MKRITKIKTIIITIGIIIGLSFFINSDSCYYQNFNYRNLEKVENIKTSQEVSFEDWYRTWGVVGDSDFALEIALDSSNDVYTTGFTRGDFGPSNLTLNKYNTTGDLYWSLEWGGSGYDRGEGIVIDQFDNIYIAGSTQSFSEGGNDVWVLKYNSNGNLIWNVTWGDIQNNGGTDLAVDSDGNIFVSGWTFESGVGDKMLLLKYNSSGDLKWAQTSSIGMWGQDVAVDNATGDIYLLGDDNNAIFLVKYNSSGYEQWSRVWSTGFQDGARGLSMDSSGNLYLTGYTQMNSMGDDILIVKYNSSGYELWYRTWGWNYSDRGQNLFVDSSDNVYITGSVEEFGGILSSYDACILKYNSTGDMQWGVNWGGDKLDYGFGINIDIFDNIYISGFSQSFDDIEGDQFLLRCGPLPDIIPPNISSVNATPSEGDPDGGTIITITADLIDTSGILNVSGDIEHPDENIIVILPLYDDGSHGDTISGDNIFTNEWNCSGAPSGTYYVDIIARDNSPSQNSILFDNGTTFILIDKTPPAISLISVNPILGYPENETIITISAYITDVAGILYGLVEIEHPDENIIVILPLYDDGSHGDTISGDNIFTNEWNCSGAPSGTYYVDIIARDNSPSQNSILLDNGATFTLISDITPPTISIISVNPITGYPENGTIITISAYITDISGILDVFIEIEYPDENIIVILPLYDDGSHGDTISGDNIFTNEWNCSGAPSGTYYVDIIARDNSPSQNSILLDNGASFRIEIIDQSKPEISGYYMLILIGVISVVSGILIKRRKYYYLCDKRR